MENDKIYDLEERTYLFAKDCRLLIQKLPRTISNINDGKQLVKSSGSIAANYIEANEKLGDKDFKFRLKIARKEAKESVLWLKLLKGLNTPFNFELAELQQ
ncbi:four helix bundle protein [Flavobacteriaceae bacterium LMO-SS05]